MDLDSLSRHYGVPVVRGPDEIIDLPAFSDSGGVAPDLSRHDMRIFAEIVEAPTLSVEEIVARAGQCKAAGADMIDIGCQPDTPFPHLEDAIAPEAMRAAGQRRHRRCGGARSAARRPAPISCSASMRRRSMRLRAQGVPVLIPEAPWRPRLAHPRHRSMPRRWA